MRIRTVVMIALAAVAVLMLSHLVVSQSQAAQVNVNATCRYAELNLYVANSIYLALKGYGVGNLTLIHDLLVKANSTLMQGDCMSALNYTREAIYYGIMLLKGTGVRLNLTDYMNLLSELQLYKARLETMLNEAKAAHNKTLVLEVEKYIELADEAEASGNLSLMRVVCTRLNKTIASLTPAVNVTVERIYEGYLSVRLNLTISRYLKLGNQSAIIKLALELNQTRWTHHVFMHEFNMTMYRYLGVLRMNCTQESVGIALRVINVTIALGKEYPVLVNSIKEFFSNESVANGIAGLCISRVNMYLYSGNLDAALNETRRLYPGLAAMYSELEAVGLRLRNLSLLINYLHDVNHTLWFLKRSIGLNETEWAVFGHEEYKLLAEYRRSGPWSLLNFTRNEFMQYNLTVYDYWRNMTMLVNKYRVFRTSIVAVPLPPGFFSNLSSYINETIGLYLNCIYPLRNLSEIVAKVYVYIQVYRQPPYNLTVYMLYMSYYLTLIHVYCPMFMSHVEHAWEMYNNATRGGR